MAKVINDIPEELLKRLPQLGYWRLTPEDWRVFEPYYNAMNGHYASSISFPCLLAWSDAIPIFYKSVGGTDGSLLVCLQYDGTIKQWTALPFIGRYSQESVGNALRVLRTDMEALRIPLKVIDVSEWMEPFYQDMDGVLWRSKRPREWMDYIYQRADFEESLNSSENRYRCRYFLRHFSPETLVLTSAHTEECLDCMREVWCPGRKCSDCFACPVEAVRNVVEALDNLRADGVLVRVDGKPAGFCVVSCRNRLGLYLLKHADNRMKGINEYLLRECFTRFLSGAEEINFTEDLGNEGLRAYKRKLAPYALSPRITLKAMKLRKATPEEARLVYERDLVKAFPPMELRTWPEIENLTRRGKYEFLCLYDGADIVGTITLCPARPGWIYLDYFCVTASRRNAGLGGRLIQAFLERYSDSVILLEAEAPEHAPDRVVAARRRELYLRNGFFQAGFDAELFGVRYNILYWADAPLPDAEIQREYDNVCRDVFTPDEYERYVRIPI